MSGYRDLRTDLVLSSGLCHSVLRLEVSAWFACAWVVGGVLRILELDRSMEKIPDLFFFLVVGVFGTNRNPLSWMALEHGVRIA